MPLKNEKTGLSKLFREKDFLVWDGRHRVTMWLAPPKPVQCWGVPYRETDLEQIGNHPLLICDGSTNIGLIYFSLDTA